MRDLFPLEKIEPAALRAHPPSVRAVLDEGERGVVALALGHAQHRRAALTDLQQAVLASGHPQRAFTVFHEVIDARAGLEAGQRDGLALGCGDSEAPARQHLPAATRVVAHPQRVLASDTATFFCPENRVLPEPLIQLQRVRDERGRGMVAHEPQLRATRDSRPASVVR